MLFTSGNYWIFLILVFFIYWASPGTAARDHLYPARQLLLLCALESEICSSALWLVDD